MFRRIASFFRRLFNSKGFQRGLRIFCLVFIGYFVYSVILFLNAAMKIGIPFWDALRSFFHFLLFNSGRFPPSASIALGIAIGLIWYFNRKRKNTQQAEPDEKAEASSDTVQEEEIIEPTHYRYH